MSLDSLLGLYNTLSQTNHHNLALLVGLLIAVLHRRIFSWIVSGSRIACDEFATATRLVIKKNLKGSILLGIFIIFGVLVLFTPTSDEVSIKGVWTPIALSAPSQNHDLDSMPPRSSDEIGGTKNNEGLANREAIPRKAVALSLWFVIFSYLALIFRRIYEWFDRVEKVLQSWRRSACQLLDLPPPASLPAYL